MVEVDLPRKVCCSLCTDTARYGTDTTSYGSCSRKGLHAQGLCNVLPPTSNVGVLRCTATTTVLIVLSYTLHKHWAHLQWTTSGTLLICHYLQCNQSCHQFIAKHTLMSFIADLWYFVSWCNYNDQTCFSFLDAVISELLTTAPVHVDKHIWPERKVIMFAAFVVYVRSIESLDIDLCLSMVCSSGRKPESTVTSVSWVAVWNRIKCQEMGFFLYLWLRKSLELQGTKFPTPTGWGERGGGVLPRDPTGAAEAPGTPLVG